MSKLTVAAIALSGVGHAGAYVALERMPRFAEGAFEHTTVSFNILPAEQLPAPAEASEPEPEPEPPVPEPARHAAPAPAEPPPPDPVDAQKPTEEVAVDLTGITLTNAAGVGWQSATGDGSSRAGPIRNVRSRPKPVEPPGPRP